MTNYINPLLIDYGGMKIIVTLTADHLIAVNSATGELLWKFNCEVLNAEHKENRTRVNTPIYSDGYLVAANGYTQVAVKLKLNPDGSDPALVW